MSNWIPVSERLPTREDADETGNVLKRWKNGDIAPGPWNTKPETGSTYVAWLPLPPYTPPKPGPTDTECANILHYSALACMNHFDFNDDVPLEEQFAMVRRWFAAVTARIERERGQ